MAKFIGKELPDDLYERLRGDDLEMYAEKVILICTVDANGWPHPAMLSYFEVVAKDRCNIRLATYKHSGSTNNMRRNGKLTLSVVDERVAYYIKGSVEEVKPELRCSPQISKLNLRVEQVLADQPDEQLEAHASVAGGITYKSADLAGQQWRAKEVLRELLE